MYTNFQEYKDGLLKLLKTGDINQQAKAEEM